MAPLFQLSEEEADEVLRAFERDAVVSRFGWSRRSYAPMHRFEGLHARLRAALPDYVVAFDVVFESASGAFVEWHCDWESLGPWEIPSAWRAIRDAHFVSVHFTLTKGGGALRTLAWPRLSWLAHKTIAWGGLYRLPHRLFNLLARPLFWLCATRHVAPPRAGVAFDNMRLHAVGAGAPRVSYVVRLVRRGVRLSRAKVMQGVAESDAVLPLASHLLARLGHRDSCDAAALDEGLGA